MSYQRELFIACHFIFTWWVAWKFYMIKDYPRAGRIVDIVILGLSVWSCQFRDAFDLTMGSWIIAVSVSVLPLLLILRKVSFSDLYFTIASKDDFRVVRNSEIYLRMSIIYLMAPISLIVIILAWFFGKDDDDDDDDGENSPEPVPTEGLHAVLQ